MTRRIVNFEDIETTGINDPAQRIIEYCGMHFDLDTEEHIATLTLRFNPMRKIEAQAQKVHGISLADLENEPTWDTQAHRVADFINQAYANVAHNGDEFDFPFIGRECARVGVRLGIQRPFDTMKRARWATPYGKNPRLGELAHCLDIPYDPSKAHGAEYDVHVMAQSFFAGRRLGWFEIN